MPKYHLLDKDGTLIRTYEGVDVEILDRVIRIFSSTPRYETEAIISLAPGDRLERVSPYPGTV